MRLLFWLIEQLAEAWKNKNYVVLGAFLGALTIAVVFSVLFLVIYVNSGGREFSFEVFFIGLILVVPGAIVGVILGAIVTIARGSTEMPAENSRSEDNHSP